MAINKVQYGSNVLIDLTSDTVTADSLKTGITAHDKSGAVITGTMSSGGGGLPTGFSAIATGSHTISSNVIGSNTFTVTHNLGVVPDMFLFYADGNIAQTYSMIYAMRSSAFTWRGSSYTTLMGYHGNSTTSMTYTQVTSSYGIKTLTSTQATITSYNTSTSYGWRSGKYKWIAIKF